MENKIEAGISLIGIMDGTSINGFLRVDNTPLIQCYTPGTNKFIPDFKTMAENKRPTAVPILHDVSTGEVLIPGKVTFLYNSKALTFGADGLCNTAGFEGLFKLIKDYQATVGAKQYTLPALRIMDNLVPISGYDNDRLSISGEIEVDGSTIEFAEISTPVVISEATGSTYAATITSDKGFYITSDVDTVVLKANLYKDAGEITDFAGIQVKWYKITTEGEQALGEERTQSINKAMVNNVLNVRCDFINAADGSELTRAFAQVTDVSDPYYVQFNVTGISGTIIRKGQTALVSPVAVSRDGGVTKPCAWTYRLTDNKGADITSKFNTSGQSVSITYDDMKTAGFGIHLYVSGKVTV